MRLVVPEHRLQKRADPRMRKLINRIARNPRGPVVELRNEGLGPVVACEMAVELKVLVSMMSHSLE